MKAKIWAYKKKGRKAQEAQERRADGGGCEDFSLRRSKRIKLTN